MIIRISVLLVYVLLVIACTSESALSEVDGLIENIDEFDADAPWAALVLDMTQAVNEARSERRVCGETSYDAAPPLRWSGQLADAAHEHSLDMAQNNHFNHEGTDGSSPGNRIRRQGYSAVAWGENIAAGYPTVREVVQGWLDSPGHCANIMSPDFREFGASNVENSRTQYGIFWTQVFAAPQ